jgi:hypothetical protein
MRNMGDMNNVFDPMVFSQASHTILALERFQKVGIHRNMPPDWHSELNLFCDG